MAVSYQNCVDWSKASRSVDAMAYFREDDFNLTGTGNSERLSGRMTSAAMFPILGVNPVLGRVFSADEDRPGAAPVVLIGEKLWTRKFGADRSIIGRAITLNGTSHTVLGVLPASFQFRGGFDVTVPVGQWKSVLLT